MTTQATIRQMVCFRPQTPADDHEPTGRLLQVGSRLERRLTAIGGPVLGLTDADRPQTRADCIDGPRPCPFVGCRHHLASDAIVSADAGRQRVLVDLGWMERDDEAPSCALDVVDANPEGATVNQVAEALGLSEASVRRIEEAGLAKLRSNGVMLAQVVAP